MLSILLLLLIQNNPASTVQFVRNCLQADGGYSNSPAAKSTSLSTTSASLRVLNYLKTKPEQLSKTKAYCWACFDRNNGVFRDRPDGKPSYRSTAVGVMAIVALKERFSDQERERVLKSLLHSEQPEEIRLGAAALEALLIDKQLSSIPPVWLEKLNSVFNPHLRTDGSYGQGHEQARNTAGYVAAYLRLGYPHTSKDGLLKLLQVSQLESGGWSNEKGELDLEATYRVMRCLYLMQCRDIKVLDRCEKLISGLKQADGGYALPGQLTSSVSATYFALSIQHWLQELRAK